MLHGLRARERRKIERSLIVSVIAGAMGLTILAFPCAVSPKEGLRIATASSCALCVYAKALSVFRLSSVSE